jgi:hypothetical protein
MRLLLEPTLQLRRHGVTSRRSERGATNLPAGNKAGRPVRGSSKAQMVLADGSSGAGRGPYGATLAAGNFG